jgi:hypothetical protein
MRCRIDGDHRIGAEVDVVGCVPVAGFDVPLLQILFGSQVRLGQRWASERDARFPADEHDRSIEPLVTQRCGGRAPGLSTTNDHRRSRARSRHALFNPWAHYCVGRGAPTPYGDE